MTASETNRRAAADALTELARSELGLHLEDAMKGANAPLAELLHLLDTTDAGAVATRLRSREPVAVSAAVRAVTIGETYFLRHPEQFRALAELATKSGGVCRVWSAACASGEEAYSAAITLADAGIAFEITATDINPAFIARAREGLYGEWSFRDVPPAIRERWFHKDGKKAWRVSRALRDKITFQVGNLVRDVAPASMNVVFCRNMLIYVHADELPLVTDKLVGALVDGGVLFTAPTDPRIEVAGVRLRHIGETIAYRREAGARTTARRRARPAPSASSAEAPARRARPRPPSRPPPHVRLATAAALAAKAPVPRDDRMERALALADAGDTRAALILLDALLVTPVLSVEPYLVRAVVRQQAGEATATADVDRVLYLARLHPYARFLAGAESARHGDVDRARRHLDVAVKNAALGAANQVVTPPLPLTFGELASAAGQLLRRLGGKS